MTGTLQPLDNKFPIVDKDGRPTDYFIRWAQQKQIDIGASATQADLDTKLTVVDDSVNDGPGFWRTVPGFQGLNIGDNRTDGTVSIGYLPGAYGYIAGDAKGFTSGWFLGGSANAQNRLRWGTYGVIVGFSFDQDIYVTTHKVYHDGNLTFGTGLTYTAGVLTAGAGGGGYSFEGFGNLLTIAGLTNIPAASANITKTDGTKAHKFSWTASGSNTVQGATMAVPATPWNLYCRFIPAKTTFSGNVQFGLIVRNSVSGKLILFAFNSNTNISVQNWINPTTFSSQVTTVSTQPIYWLRINNDGTNLNFYTGTNGIDWDLFSTQTLASFIGSVDQAGLGGVPFAAAAAWVSDFGFTVPA